MKLANLVQLIFLGTTLASPLHPVMSRPGEPGLATHAGSPERHGPFHGGLPPNETHWPVVSLWKIFDDRIPSQSLQIECGR